MIHDTIQYLVERSENEQKWLERCPIARPDDADLGPVRHRFAAAGRGLHLEQVPGNQARHNEFWLLPRANHYLQHDAPEGFAAIVTATLTRQTPESPGALADEPDAPILVDRSRPKLRSAADVLNSR